MVKLQITGYIEYAPSLLERTLEASLNKRGISLSQPNAHTMQENENDMEPINRDAEAGNLKIYYTKWFEHSIEPFRNNKQIFQIPISEFYKLINGPETNYRENIGFEDREEFFTLFFEDGKLSQIDWDAYYPSHNLATYINKTFNLGISLKTRPEHDREERNKEKIKKWTLTNGLYHLQNNRHIKDSLKKIGPDGLLEKFIDYFF